MALEKELKTYDRELPNLLDRCGKYVLIREDQVAGVWDTYEDAIQEGYRVYGLVPFLVKQIQTVEYVHHLPNAEPVCRS